MCVITSMEVSFHLEIPTKFELGPTVPFWAVNFGGSANLVGALKLVDI